MRSRTRRIILLVAVGVVVTGGLLALVVPQLGGSKIPIPAVLQPKNKTIVPVLPSVSASCAPAAATVAKALEAAERKEIGVVGAVILDAATGQVLAAENDGPMMPASTLKTITSAVALEVMGPDKVFVTSVVQPNPGEIVLVGGGDPYLRAGDDSPNDPATASLQDLARSTAKELTRQGLKKVTLGFDEGLFTGPNWHQDWGANYSVEVPDITPLWADKGDAEPKDRKEALEKAKKEQKNKRGKAPQLPPMPEAEKATQIFADQLRELGLDVQVTGAKAGSGAKTIASVESMPLSRIVRQLMLTSDNAAAEVILRQTALAAGRPGSFADGAEVIVDHLKKWGFWRDGMEIRDGSGLSRSNRVTPSALAGVIRKAMAEEKLRPAVWGMPVSAATGTLGKRYAKPEQEAGRGVVHAKTGFVNNTNGLAGFVRTKPGAVVVFALLLNDAPLNQAPVQWLDDTATELAKCGC